jgi:hypothetical protein
MKNEQIMKTVILEGEGTHRHVIHGDLVLKSQPTGFNRIQLDKDALLCHETPEGEPAEHRSLPLKKGRWIMGKQVEFDPFTKKISRVWD